MAVTSRSQFFGTLWRRGRVVLLLFLAWSILAWGAARALVVRAELPHADALVVLAGSATYVERTQRAAQLFANGVAARIVLTTKTCRADGQPCKSETRSSSNSPRKS